MKPKYTKKQKLGEGTYCSVFRAINNETNEDVALKLVRMDQEEDGIPGTSLREISFLRTFHHPNIVILQDVLCDDSKLQLIFEFMDSDLRKYINAKKTIHNGLLKSYTFQLLCGILFLHSNGIIHQNIRPENILIRRDGFLKIGDFGTAVSFQRPMLPMDARTTLLWYKAPELVIEAPDYDFSIDIWSCGCVLAEMATGESLFKGDSPVDQIMKICKMLGNPEKDWPEFKNLIHPLIKLPEDEPISFSKIFPENTDHSFIDLLSKMLVINPKKRITAKEAIHHEYFKGLQKQLIDVCMPLNV